MIGLVSSEEIALESYVSTQPTGLKEAYWAVGLEYTHHNSGYH